MRPSVHRLAFTVGLVLLSIPISLAGRWLLDLLIAANPSSVGIVERFGGWAVGMVVVVLVVIPLFRLWGLFRK